MEVFLVAQTVADAEKAVDLMERFVALGPMAVVTLFILLFFGFIALGVAFIRLQVKDKDGDNQTIEELRGIRGEQKHTTEAVREANTRNDDNYLALKTVMEQSLGATNNLVTAVEKQAATIDKLIEHNTTIHQQTQKAMQDSMKQISLDFFEEIAGERATAMAGAQFQFPPDDDCRWEVAVIRPTVGRNAKIYHQPIFHDHNMIDMVRPTSEVVKVITRTTVSGWYAIYRQFGGEEAVKGWVHNGMVTVTRLSDESEIEDTGKETPHG